MSIGFSDLSRGLVIELDGQPWEIMDYQRHKMQQRAPVTRLKMKNLLNGSVLNSMVLVFQATFWSDLTQPMVIQSGLMFLSEGRD